MAHKGWPCLHPIGTVRHLWPNLSAQQGALHTTALCDTLKSISTGAEFAQHGKTYSSNTVTRALQSTGASFRLHHVLLTGYWLLENFYNQTEGRWEQLWWEQERNVDGSVSEFVQGTGQHKCWETKAGKLKFGGSFPLMTKPPAPSL